MPMPMPMPMPSLPMCNCTSRAMDNMDMVFRSLPAGTLNPLLQSGMSMYFQSSSNVQLIFESWSTSTTGEYILSLAAVFLFACMQEVGHTSTALAGLNTARARGPAVEQQLEAPAGCCDSCLLLRALPRAVFSYACVGGASRGGWSLRAASQASKATATKGISSRATGGDCPYPARVAISHCAVW